MSPNLGLVNKLEICDNSCESTLVQAQPESNSALTSTGMNTLELCVETRLTPCKVAPYGSKREPMVNPGWQKAAPIDAWRCPIESLNSPQTLVIAESWGDHPPLAILWNGNCFSEGMRMLPKSPVQTVVPFPGRQALEDYPSRKLLSPAVRSQTIRRKVLVDVIMSVECFLERSDLTEGERERYQADLGKLIQKLGASN